MVKRRWGWGWVLLPVFLAAGDKRDSVNPYANDLGPAALDVSQYPAEHQRGYRLMLDKCSTCHTPARPLNSQFVEFLEADAEESKKIAALRKTRPELFEDRRLLRLEAGIYRRYIKRMMNRPACAMDAAEGKAIHDFLCYDSVERKLKNAAGWMAHRRALLAAFEKKHPERFERLYRKK